MQPIDEHPAAQGRDETPDHFEGNIGANIAGGRYPHRASSAAQDLLLATQSGEYAAGYDAGVQAVWEKWVCSACGFNHDEDESAACEGADVISFADWYGRVSDFLRSIREWRGLT